MCKKTSPLTRFLTALVLTSFYSTEFLEHHPGSFLSFFPLLSISPLGEPRRLTFPYESHRW